MEIIHGISSLPKWARIYLTLGVFDGIHLGHKKLLARLVKEASEKGKRSLLITFDPHPRRLLDPENPPLLLTSLKERLTLISKEGVDGVVILPFTEQIARMSGEEFIKNLILQLRIEKIFVGHGYRFGRECNGDIKLLVKMGKGFGFEIVDIRSVRRDGGIISSSRIREAIANGEITKARRLLGRFPSREGQVIPGKRRGRFLGWPTANLEWQRDLILPKDGVYAVYAIVRSKRFLGMANIGNRPTFGEDRQSLEVHLLNFEEDIYGEKIKIYFVKRIRDEIPFMDVESLKRQIIKDEALVRKILIYKEEEM